MNDATKGECHEDATTGMLRSYFRNALGINELMKEETPPLVDSSVSPATQRCGHVGMCWLPKDHAGPHEAGSFPATQVGQQESERLRQLCCEILDRIAGGQWGYVGDHAIRTTQISERELDNWRSRALSSPQPAGAATQKGEVAASGLVTHAVAESVGEPMAMTLRSSTEPQPAGWIPVTPETMPEKYEHVLLVFDGVVQFAYRTTDLWRYRDYDGLVICDLDDPRASHWRPISIPAPPETK